MARPSWGQGLTPSSVEIFKGSDPSLCSLTARRTISVQRSLCLVMRDVYYPLFSQMVILYYLSACLDAELLEDGEAGLWACLGRSFHWGVNWGERPTLKVSGPFPWAGDIMEWNKGEGLNQQNECFSLACLTVDHTWHLPPQDSAYEHGTTKLWIEPSETMSQDRFLCSIFSQGLWSQPCRSDWWCTFTA